MRMALILLAAFSLSVSAETILLGKPGREFSVKQDALKAIGEKSYKGKTYAMRFKKGVVNLESAQFEIDGSGNLVLNAMEIGLPMEGLEGELSKVVSANIPFSNKPLFKETVKSSTAHIKDGGMRLRLMGPQVLFPVADLTTKESKELEGQLRTSLETILLPRKNVKTLDDKFQTKMYGDFGGLKGGLEDFMIDQRMDLADDMIQAAIDWVAKEVKGSSSEANAYALLPAHISTGYELKSQRVEGEPMWNLVAKGKDSPEVSLEIRKQSYQTGLVALTGEEATHWIQGYLNSFQADKLPSGYTKGEGSILNYAPSKAEAEVLAKIVGAPVESLTMDIFAIKVSFFSRISGEKKDQYIQVALTVNDKRIAGRYRISSSDLSLAEVVSEDTVVEGVAPKFFARDLKNIIVQSLVPRSMVGNIGKTDTALRISLCGTMDDRADSFGEALQTGGYLVIKQ